ncbi:uncharacterized protein [Oryctolagus cuniculus]|uniref:uncharacterized protein n=1 Tax=Oryctolagus cuniculus TaxID=9986 RepID=UPI00387A2BF5
MAARGHTARREGQGSGAERRSGRGPRAEASGRRGEEPETPGGRSGADRKRCSPAEPAHPGPSRRACVSGRAHSHRVSIEGARPHRRLRGSGEQGPVLRGCPAGRHQPSALYCVAGGCSGPAVGKAAGSFLESLFWGCIRPWKLGWQSWSCPWRTRLKMKTTSAGIYVADPRAAENPDPGETQRPKAVPSLDFQIDHAFFEEASAFFSFVCPRIKTMTTELQEGWMAAK